MKWYVNVINKYADFTGRSRRQEYWSFFSINIVLGLFITYIDEYFDIRELLLGGFIFTLYTIFILLPGMAVSARRLHDIGKSGWWIFIGLVPLAGGLYLLYLLTLDSDPNENEYGPFPKTSSVENKCYYEVAASILVAVFFALVIYAFLTEIELLGNLGIEVVIKNSISILVIIILFVFFIKKNFYQKKKSMDESNLKRTHSNVSNCEIYGTNKFDSRP